MFKKVLMIATVIFLVLVVISPVVYPLQAQNSGAISVSNSKANLSFPQSLSFTADIKSSVSVQDIRLRYSVDQMSFAKVVSEGYVSFNPSTSVKAQYDLDMRRFGGFPSGTMIHYWWAVKDANHNFLESPAIDLPIVDNRYNWKNKLQGKISLYWYSGDNSFAQSLMDAAQSALVKLAKDTGATPDKVIQIYIYANSQDLQGSMIYPNEWTGGVSFSQYNIIAIGITPSNLAWGEGAMTHELTHNVIGQVIFNPYSNLPVWFNEGLAMYNEGPLTSQFTAPLSQAIRNNQLISVMMISSPFSAYSDKANLSYAESYTLMEYLLQTYGAQKMSDLLAAFKSGNTYDGAFTQVLGLDMNSLNQQWQPWVKTNYAR